MKQIAWDVFRIEEDECWRTTRRVDTVFYDENCDAQYVHKGLVDHDGYPPDIIVRNSQLHDELSYNGYDLYDYAYDTEQDVEKVEEMYMYPADAAL